MKAYRQLLITLFAFMIMLPSCIQYNFQRITEVEPEIEVAPTQHDFGALYAGVDNDQLSIVITNIGGDHLEIFDIYLSNGQQNFSLDLDWEGFIPPGEQVIFQIHYSPRTYESNYDELVILSDDTDERITTIPLVGYGDAPVIDVSPLDFQFADTFIECLETTEIEITNLGNVDLEVYNIDYYATTPADLYPEDYESKYGPYPWVVSPNEAMVIELDYYPLDTIEDQGYFQIESNDPQDPIYEADQRGRGKYQNHNSDQFTQGDPAPVDILFVIDNSCSMGPNQVELSDNFNIFINTFAASQVDYRIAFITTDSPYFVGDVITRQTPDPVAEAMAQINSIGTSGSGSEKGMDNSKESLTSPGDASPGEQFFREGALLVVIYISDEDDSSTTSPTEMSNFLKGLKASDSLVIAHAVAGDVPGGCTGNGNAQSGKDYYSLVTKMGGTFLSICDEDWGTPMEQLANDSTGPTALYISGDPIPDTIEVFVEGNMYHDWVYDSSENLIYFTVYPAEGSSIVVSYAVRSDCAI